MKNDRPVRPKQLLTSIKYGFTKPTKMMMANHKLA